MSNPEQELLNAKRAADRNMRHNSGRNQAIYERRVDIAQAEVKRATQLKRVKGKGKGKGKGK